MTISLRAGADGTSGAVQIGGVDKLVFNADGSTSVPGVLTNIVGRNRIINGAMEIDQRNSGSSVALTSTSVYTLDRWIVGVTGNLTAQRTGQLGARSITLTGGTGGATLVNLVQRIEALNIADLAGKTVTLSFVASGSGVTSLPWSVTNATASDNFSSVSAIQSGTVTITSTTTKYSLQITLPSAASNGLAIALTNQASIPAGASITITNVQLEEGSVASTFERRQYTQELALCQRYYWALGSAVFVPGHNAPGVGWQAGQRVANPVSMRASPTVTTNFSGPVGNISAQEIVNPGINGFQVLITSAGAGSFFTTYSAGNSASAEL